MDRTQHRPQPQFTGQGHGRRQFVAQYGPLGALPVRRAGLLRAANRHDLLVRACHRAFWEVHEPRACLVRVAHQAAYLLSAVSQRRDVAGISVDGDLRNGKAHGLGFRRRFSWRGSPEVLESRGVGLAGLGCAGSYPALEIPVRCHSSGLPRSRPRVPKRPRRPRQPDQDSDPRQESLCLHRRPCRGRSREVRRGPRRRGNSSDRLSLQQVTSPAPYFLSRRPLHRPGRRGTYSRGMAALARQLPAGCVRGVRRPSSSIRPTTASAFGLNSAPAHSAGKCPAS